MEDKQIDIWMDKQMGLMNGQIDEHMDRQIDGIYEWRNRWKYELIDRYKHKLIDGMDSLSYVNNIQISLTAP